MLLAALFAAAVCVEAQNQARFPDGGFENVWEWNENVAPGKTNYWDFFDDYFLSTLNQLHQLTGEMGDAPLTSFRMENADAYDGRFSIKLVSNRMTLGNQPIFLPGVAATLFIDFMGPTCDLGEPFTSRPTAIKGFHKYAPVNGDSAAIEVMLKKGAKLLGRGKRVITETISNWTEFSVPISYTSQETPDMIIVIFASSGNYDFTDIETLMLCKGQLNSTYCLDNVEFDYGTDVKEMLFPEVKLTVYPNPTSENVTVQVGKETKGSVIIYDNLMRKVGEYPIDGARIDVDIQDFASGSYLINVLENNRVVTTGRFLKE
jgi:hypothetical protein